MEVDMSEIMEAITDEQPGETLSWSKVWISVLTKPSIATFERILRDPQASPRRAYLWIFTSFFVAGLINVLISIIGSMTTGYNTITCGPLIEAVVAILSLALVTWVIQSIASRLFGGSGTYASLIYAFAAWAAPMYLVSSVIGEIPYINFCLTIPLAIYGIVLGVIAVKAVNKIGWGQAAASYIGGFVLLIGVVAVFTVCALVILGPNVSDVFQNTLNQLESAAQA
jgi:hypothetical protein